MFQIFKYSTRKNKINFSVRYPVFTRRWIVQQYNTRAKATKQIAEKVLRLLEYVLTFRYSFSSRSRGRGNSRRRGAKGWGTGWWSSSRRGTTRGWGRRDGERRGGSGRGKSGRRKSGWGDRRWRWKKSFNIVNCILAREITALYKETCFARYQLFISAHFVYYDLIGSSHRTFVKPVEVF